MAPHASTAPSTSPPPSYPPSISPSLPHPSPSTSYWHQTTPSFPYRNHNSTTPPPSHSPIVVLGSGLSASLLAYTLLTTHSLPPTSLLLLEARSACSGATSRNAGHCRPDAFRGFAAYSRIHGVEQAKKILRSERETFERVRAFVREMGVECDFEDTVTRDVCLTEGFAREEGEALKGFREVGGDVEHVRVFDGEGEAVGRSGVEGAKAVYEWPAGRMDRDDAERGRVKAEKVVHCTNAYAAYLLPQLRDFLTPNRAQAHAFPPVEGLEVRKETMSLRYGLKHFFSFIQRREDGTVIFGTSRENPSWTQSTRDGLITFDDSGYNAEVALTAEREHTKLSPSQTIPPNHGDVPGNYWTGIIAMTPDSVPLVGPIDGLDGQYICAGFNGHGMARIWTAAPGLAKLIMGEEWAATGLPECFRYSEERLEKAKRRDLKSVW
ncbi:uncharacterized protein MYCGRDRAFT_92807 [Zymoseptoria tritici IPO323]|uniref:FAD dependent oxidoreductase domain-containing protein n=1 Tax=Zymoseptoria tritici (strain CBS 115943 / IPO323) TaxID=336722 RepID=F9XAD6_ZYMTI|nr:uncharacterized protein MYCGRDRAFT_92807 [Zymoseptoria tritici IPO323]EGP88096.1 hypothetical protein MYCGRDRAFT_92807 [Zymoseptoria tritici IPO323]